MSFPALTKACGAERSSRRNKFRGSGRSRNPRTKRRSGCTPAEPYPPNRTKNVAHNKTIKSVTHVPGRKCNPCIGTNSSRWLSGATPPVHEPIKNVCILKGCQPRGYHAGHKTNGLASLQDAFHLGGRNWWCRCAQPPATSWDASGIHWHPRRCSGRPGEQPVGSVPHIARLGMAPDNL